MNKTEKKFRIVEFDFDSFVESLIKIYQYQQPENELLILLLTWTDDYNPTLHQQTSKYS